MLKKLLVLLSFVFTFVLSALPVAAKVNSITSTTDDGHNFDIFITANDNLPISCTINVSSFIIADNWYNTFIVPDQIAGVALPWKTGYVDFSMGCWTGPQFTVLEGIMSIPLDYTWAGGWSFSFHVVRTSGHAAQQQDVPPPPLPGQICNAGVALVFNTDDGISVYRAEPDSGQLTIEVIHQTLETMSETPEVDTLIVEDTDGLRIALYHLASGEFQVQVGPIESDHNKVYDCIWSTGHNEDAKLISWFVPAS